MQVLTKIKENRKLKMLVIIAVVVILILAISLVIALLPLLGKIFTFITQLDLKGLQDYITGLLAKILNG
jgi:membrane-associated HD superfamily phosphohydrolase